MIFAHLFQTASNSPTDVSALESSISALERAISALESAVKALESRSVPWEQALPWFTLAVLVGVALEWWVIRHDFREEMEGWAIFDFIGIVRFPSRPSLRKFLVEITGVALIVFGIFGELAIGLKIASINGALRGKSAELRSKNAELRSKSDQLLALVTQQAGSARDAAKQAWEYAAWRTISEKQARSIRELIQPLKGHKIVFFGNFQDAETQRFAKQLAAVLDSKIMDVSSGVWNVSITTPPGMTFGVGKNRKEDFRLIVKALNDAGVEKASVLEKLATAKGIPNDWLTVTIGPLH